MLHGTRDRLAIRLRGAVKRYGPITAVDGLDLDVPEGTCVGLPAERRRKSTTMRLLTAQAIADEGELQLPASSFPSSRSRRGCSSASRRSSTTSTPRSPLQQNLLVFSHLYRIPRAERCVAIERALELAKLVDRRDARVDELSGGMRRRLLIARRSSIGRGSCSSTSRRSASTPRCGRSSALIDGSAPRGRRS